MTKRVKVLVPYQAEIADAIQQVLGDKAIVVRSERSAEDMLRHGSDAQVVVSGRIPREYLLHAHGLKMIQTFGAGVDKIDLDLLRERGDVILCNCHVNAPEVAEYAISLLLALAKNLVLSDRELRRADWRYTWGGPRPNIEVRGKTCLILGLGHIGREVAERLRALGVTVKAATRSGISPSSHLVSEVVSIENVRPLVREADFVILTLPLTRESRGLVNREFISWMKSTALLVNVARGEIVDEKDLFEALREGRIAGAAIDAWWQYPKVWGGSGCFPSAYPYHELDNVIMSPHRAAFSEGIRDEQTRFVGENILRFLHGETPLNIVDLHRGY
ncbi:MAG: 2-hydroxyacid dehydrogenase [Candidatus Thorarchaeota archaeon]